SGEVSREPGGIYKKNQAEYVQGRITVKDSAFGFVDIDENTESIFIPPGHTNGAFSGDYVKVLVTEKDNARGPVGKVVEILEPAFTFLFGQLNVENNYCFVRPIRNGSPDIVIPIEQMQDFPDIEEGDWVKIEITERNSNAVKGKLIEKVGDAGNLNHELDAVIAEFGLEREYTPEEEKSAGRLRQRPIKRKDLRKENVMTIDPIDAKDFDDALSIHDDSDSKTIVIGVHIADVAAYISPNGVWQKLIQKRCFTAYLPGRMVPMLPKVLVTNRCSLIEGADKPAHTVLLHINRRTGKVEQFERFHSTINVKKRLNYEEVQDFADAGFKHDEWSDGTKKDLEYIYKLSQKMRDWRRKNENFIPLEAPEVRVLCDHNTMEIKGLKHEKARESNQLVEEFMLAANVAVAMELSQREIPGLYRVHPEPDPETVDEFTANSIGIYGLNPGDLTDREQAVKFLNEIRTLPEAEVVSFDFLRMMQRALYSEKASIHYGLGKQKYSHFTSPIRRLSDLIVHQQLWESECGRRIFNTKKCAAEAAHITEKERTIDDAYRAASTRFKLYFIRQQMDLGNNKTEAFISRITPKGVKVFIQEYGLYSSIHIKKFEDDYYEVDQNCRYIVGRSSGIKIHCGDKIPLLVEDVNFARRDLDLVPILEGLQPSPKKPLSGKKKNPSKKKPDKRKSSSKKPGKNTSPTSPKAVFQSKESKPGKRKKKTKGNSRKKRK
ncbi:MAG: ribonuclease R, partial [Lentisphaeraceae bacterium]|nr:ribonuclease R [Lentisphaeraceae bacterium]